jgi:GNAT superfamily N-acetyltransferase
MSKISMHIREAEYKEVSVLSGMISKSFRDVAQRFNLTPQNCPKHPSNCTDDWITSDIERGVTYYFLEYNRSLVGCVALEKANPEQFYLERLCVLPEYRRKGFGKALVEYIFNQAKSMGAKQIGIGIISKQAELKSWYQKIGFVEKEIKEFSHLPFEVSFMEYKL